MGQAHRAFIDILRVENLETQLIAPRLQRLCIGRMASMRSSDDVRSDREGPGVDLFVEELKHIGTDVVNYHGGDDAR